MNAAASRCLAGLVLAAVLASTAPAAAQIVNTQPLLSKVGDGASGELRISLDWRTGNTRLFRSIASALFTYTDGDDTLISSSKLDFGRAGDADFVSQLFTHLRYQRVFSDLLTWEVFGQVSTAKTKRLDLRALAGTGPRFALVPGPAVSAHLGVAYMFEHELVQDDGQADAGVRENNHRASAYLTGRFSVAPTITLTHTTFVQPRLDAFFDDLRVLSITDIAFNVVDRLALTIGFEIAWDSDPPDAVEELDTTLLFGLAWGF